FDAFGKLTAGLNAKLEVDLPFLKLDKTFDIAQVTLLDFNASCDDNAPPGGGTPTAVLGHISTGNGDDKDIPAGTLILNMGPFAKYRQSTNTTDGDEVFTVTHLGGTAAGEKLRLEAFGGTQEFDGIKAIYADGGAGNDTITFVGGVGHDTPGVLAAATVK